MRQVFILFLFLLSITAFSQKRTADIYKKHRFACDSGLRQIEMNVCSGEKAHFADTLMNRLYQKMVRFLDGKIQAETKRLKNHGLDLSDRAFAEKERVYYRTTKLALIKSQSQWKRSRDADCELERVGCEGGSACNYIVNSRYIEMTLARITALENFDLLN
jgi:uncharacterized protein YecT (DUF1311 family)